MDWIQTLTIVGTGLTIIGTLGALIIGLHKVTNQRIDDTNKRMTMHIV